MASKDSSAELTRYTDAAFRARYQVGDLLNVGGAGEVHRAVQISLDRPLVLKVLRPDLADDQTAYARFNREGRFLSQFPHPRVVGVYEIGFWEDRPFLALEYVEGGTLSRWLAARPADAVEPVLRICVQLCEALEFLHSQGILHRDVKPDNILMTSAGEVKLADLGLARTNTATALTEDGTIVGTLRYLAPEILSCSEFSERSDLYAVGTIMYRALAGRLPFDDEHGDISQIIAQRINMAPPPVEQFRADLPPALTTLINRLVSPDPATRPGTAGSVRHSLLALLGEPSGPAPQPLSSRRNSNRGEGGRTIIGAPASHAPAPGPRAAAKGASRSPGPGRFPLGFVVGAVILGAIGGVLWQSGRVSIRSSQVDVGVRTAVAHYETTAPCSSIVWLVPKGDGSPGRRIQDSSPATTVHRVRLDQLVPGQAYSVEPVLPGERRGARLEFRTQVPGAQGLTLVRRPGSVKLALTSLVPARLSARAVPTIPGLGTVAGSWVREESATVQHVLDVRQLSPRDDYDIEMKLILPVGEEVVLPSKRAPCPIRDLVRLANDIEALHLEEECLQMSHSGPKIGDEKFVEPLRRMLRRVSWDERSTRLAEVVDDIYRETRPSPQEKFSIYGALMGLRFVDRLAATWETSLRTGVEALVPPDLKWSETSRLPAGCVASTRAFPPNSHIIYEDFNFALAIEGTRIPTFATLSLDVPKVTAPRRAQFALTISNIQTNGFKLTLEGHNNPLILIPQVSQAFAEKPVTLYHSFPAELLGTGRLGVRVSVAGLPDWSFHPRAMKKKIVWSEMTKNNPLLMLMQIAMDPQPW